MKWHVCACLMSIPQPVPTTQPSKEPQQEAGRDTSWSTARSGRGFRKCRSAKNAGRIPAGWGVWPKGDMNNMGVVTIIFEILLTLNSLNSLYLSTPTNTSGTNTLCFATPTFCACWSSAVSPLGCKHLRWSKSASAGFCYPKLPEFVKNWNPKMAKNDRFILQVCFMGTSFFLLRRCGQRSNDVLRWRNKQAGTGLEKMKDAQLFKPGLSKLRLVWRVMLCYVCCLLVEFSYVDSFCLCVLPITDPFWEAGNLFRNLKCRYVWFPCIAIDLNWSLIYLWCQPGILPVFLRFWVSLLVISRFHAREPSC